MIEINNDGGALKKIKLPFKPKYIKSVDGTEVIDIFDIFYRSGEEKVSVRFLGKNGESKEVKIRGEFLNLFSYEPINPKRCGCKCIFCFVDQLPKGLRSALYHKDEDYRLSYLYGNYVTLANITKADIERIIKYKLTPLYISVHSTDETIRRLMLGRKKLTPILELLYELRKGGIKFHCQIVLCPDINDNENLNKTIKDLSNLYPAVESVAVVPVGLTKHREGLFKLRQVEKKDAERAYKIVAELQKRFIKTLKRPFVYLSDEFYILLNKDIPPRNFYKDFSQYENGVGILRKFIDNAERFLKREIVQINDKRKIGLLTGELAYGIVKKYIDIFSEKLKLEIELIPVKNYTFGDTVTVTGLITAFDIIKNIGGKKFDLILIPNIMLKEKSKYFLDDISIEELSKRLATEILEFEPTLSGLYNKIIRWTRSNRANI